MLSVAFQIFLIAGWCLLAGPGAFAQQQPAATPPLSKPRRSSSLPVTAKAEFVGSMRGAAGRAAARVEGFLDSVNFTEGSYVQAGSTTFEIEKDQYQAAVAASQAQLEAASTARRRREANLKNGDITLTRQKELVTNQHRCAIDRRPGAGAPRFRGTRRSSRPGADRADADAITTAQLNLSYTDIISPSPAVSARRRSPQGNLVSPHSGTLATVVQTDPIRVVFSISDREYLKVVDALKPNDQGRHRPSGTLQAEADCSDGTDYDPTGKIAFLDKTIDPSTGTIAVFAEFPNPQLKLVPGQFVTVTVQTGRHRRAAGRSGRRRPAGPARCLRLRPRRGQSRRHPPRHPRPACRRRLGGHAPGWPMARSSSSRVSRRSGRHRRRSPLPAAGN